MTALLLEAITIPVAAAVIVWAARISWRHIWERPLTGMGRGWWLIVAGFALLFLQSVFDLTNEFDQLGRFFIVGSTPTETLLERLTRLLGFIALFVGYVHWRPAVTMHNRLVREIEFRQETEEALARFGQHMELVLNTAADVIYSMNEAGVATFVNPAATGMLGWEPEELVGKRIHPIVHHTRPDGTHIPVEACPISLALQDGVTRRTDAGVLWRKDGTSLPVEFTCSPLVDADKVVGAVVTFQDITARRAESEQAARVQAELLPSDVPSLPGFELAARCVPSRNVGGDFFDWQEPSPGTTTLTLSNVMGKGMPAALVMARIGAALRAVAQDSPAEAFQSAASALEPELFRTGKYATIFHAQLDVAHRRLDYVDAGHGHVFLRRADGQVAGTKRGGLPIGLLPDGEWHQESLSFQTGDTLVVYSDGLVERYHERDRDQPNWRRRSAVSTARRLLWSSWFPWLSTVRPLRTT